MSNYNAGVPLLPIVATILVLVWIVIMVVL
jgi:hypothetical protein